MAAAAWKASEAVERASYSYADARSSGLGAEKTKNLRSISLYVVGVIVPYGCERFKTWGS